MHPMHLLQSLHLFPLHLTPPPTSTSPHYQLLYLTFLHPLQHKPFHHSTFLYPLHTKLHHQPFHLPTSTPPSYIHSTFLYPLHH
ncbi:hypothetical protein Pmani_034286 [Petrolisthes manimaculis]|uniref:Uncharacterized protein n=1 Tax=Petrolisthes manimaculis TaxID=1843537 RepID=A0AAE1TPK1_9EUCA|nr:hypothetical protein Pmani_034286 [Petrolisthes manimaculis]